MWYGGLWGSGAWDPVGSPLNRALPRLPPVRSTPCVGYNDLDHNLVNVTNTYGLQSCGEKTKNPDLIKNLIKGTAAMDDVHGGVWSPLTSSGGVQTLESPEY